MRALMFAFAAALAACTQTVELGSGDASLSGEWAMATRAPRPPTIAFADERASGFAGCNRWFGQVSRDGDSLRFSAVGTTRMMCEAPMMAIERDFLGVLERTRAARIEGDSLILLDDAGAELATFLRTR
jgi:heat shock protein HslJ